MYLRQVHIRAVRIWRVHDDKELQEMSVTLKLGISAHSEGGKTLECGNHYKVSFITLYAKTESLVHVQPLPVLGVISVRKKKHSE